MPDLGLNIPSSRAKVLLVEDEPTLLKAYERVLNRAGYDVGVAQDGASALRALGSLRYDVLLSDICLAGMSGIELVKEARRLDLDMAVLLMTAAPAVETAVQAMEHGALRYLIKPMTLDELTTTVAYAVQFRRMADARRQAEAQLAAGKADSAAELADLEAAFERALETLWIAFQPVVRHATRSVYAYEALARNEDRTLASPLALIDAAERLGRWGELAGKLRALTAQAAPGAPSDALLFVNLHPRDLLDEALYRQDAPLTAHASRCVLEITERAALAEIDNLRERVAHLRALGFRIAVDDLGAGYAGLSSVAQLEPEIIKLDMAMVRNLDQEPIRRRLVGSMVKAGADMGIQVVAEGVETAGERDALVDLGCDLLQGYLFARPGRGFPAVAW